MVDKISHVSMTAYIRQAKVISVKVSDVLIKVVSNDDYEIYKNFPA
jgi:hypothetical protein